MFANVNSVIRRTRRHYLKLFLDEHKPDILMIAEHCLSSHHRFELDGYIIHRQNRGNDRKRGTAIIVRDNIHSERFRVDTPNIENTAIRVKRPNGTTISVVCLYSRPTSAFSASNLASLDELTREGEVLVGGDLNAKHPDWGGTVTDTRGRCLHGFLLGCPDLDIVRTNGPTRITPTTQSYIDLFMASPGLGITGNSNVVQYGYSDHEAIEVYMDIDGLIEKEPTRIFNYRKMNVKRFNSLLHRNLPNCALPVDRNATTEEINDCVESMTRTFKEAMDSSVPKVQLRRGGLPDLPAEIRDLTKQRRRLHRTLYRTTDFTRYHPLKAEIRELDRIIDAAIAEYERNFYTNRLSAIDVNNMTFRKVKAAAGVRRINQVPDLKDEDSNFVVDDTGKANLLAENFSSFHGRNDHLRTGTFSDQLTEEAASLLDHSPRTTFGVDVMADGSASNGRIDNYAIRAADVGWAIRRRPPKKSVGLDGIPDIILKRTDNVVWAFLAILFNHCINLGFFPPAWKRAVIVPIPKSGSDPKSPNGYRPISLLSPFGKLLEQFILDKVRDFIWEQKLLLDNQFGFKHRHSTSSALTVLMDYVSRGLNQRCATIAASLDFAKAFDTAWQAAILRKMTTLGFDRTITRMVAAFLANRAFSVRVGDSFSGERAVTAGVPQGSLMGPVLYNILLSDIPLPPEGDLLLIYADDILVAAKGARAKGVNKRLNDYLQTLHEYFMKWTIGLNVSKSTGIIFKGSGGNIYPNARAYKPTLTIGESAIDTCGTMKYLGIILDERLSFIRHVDYVLCKVKRAFSAYYKVLGRRNGLSTDVRLLVYKQIIRPMMAYAFPAWFTISSAQMERLRIWERRILSSCLGLRRFRMDDGTWRNPSCHRIYSSVNFDRIDSFLVKMAMASLDRDATIDNGLVRGCYERAETDDLLTRRYFSPVDLLALGEGGHLRVDGRLLFYHRRYRSLDIGNTVYNVNQ